MEVRVLNMGSPPPLRRLRGWGDEPEKASSQKGGGRRGPRKRVPDNPKAWAHLPAVAVLHRIEALGFKDLSAAELKLVLSQLEALKPKMPPAFMRRLKNLIQQIQNLRE